MKKKVQDLNRIASHLKDKLERQVKELMDASNAVSQTFADIERLASIQLEASEAPKRLMKGAAPKNRHQIGKACDTCGKFIDPRAHKRHQIACRRENSKRLAA